ncbi:hypothetical protein NL676_000482 [Syzygium grande]|nr:hypothetical protein NL676_000482 [Syzygium grande]
MSGGGKPEATCCGTCVVGTPVEPRAHPTNQHAATWIAGEARPASFHSSYMNATPSSSASGFASLNQSGGDGENRPMNKIGNVLDRYGRRFKYASRKADVLTDNVWYHLRTSPNITDAAMARLAQGTKVLTEGGQDKVVLLLDQLSTVSPSSNRLNPSEKYILVVTRDGYEFWFMAFISYDRALKNIYEALQHQWGNNMAGRIQVQ